MRRLTTILLAACLLAGCQSAFVRPEATIDTSLALKLKARRLSHDAPLTAWQTVVKFPEVDDWIPVGEHHVLIGMRDMTAGQLVTTANVVTPSFGPYVLLDARDGRELWSFPRKADYGGLYSATPTPQAIVVQQVDEKGALLTGLDPATGRTLWTRSFAPLPAIAISPQHNFLLSSAVGTGGGVTAMDLSTGTSRWSAPLAMGAEARPLLQVVGDEVLVVHTDATSIAIGSGAVRWTAAAVGPVAGSALLRVAQGIALATADGGLSLVRDDGKVAWRSALGGRTRKLACSDSACYAEVEDEAGNTRLAAIEVGRGGRLWSHELPNALSSAIHVSDSAIYFTDRERLNARELATGSLRAAVPVPDSRPMRLADGLLLDGERIVVAMENGVGAYRLSDLAPVWSYRLRGHAGTLYEHASARLSTALEPPLQAKDYAEAKRKHDEWHHSFNRSVMDSSASFYGEMTRQAVSAERMQASGTRIIGGRTVSGRGGDSAMMRAATTRVIAAKEAEARFQRAQATRELSNAIGSATSDVLLAALSEYGRRAERDANIARLSAGVDMAVKVHERALLGRYYARPFGNASVTGVFIVDLVDGTWCEVATSPTESSETRGKALGTNLALALGGILVTKGTGLDPARWERDDRYRSVITVQRSMLGYDLRQLAFKPATAY